MCVGTSELSRHARREASSNSAMAWGIGARTAVTHNQVVAFMPSLLPSSCGWLFVPTNVTCWRKPYSPGGNRVIGEGSQWVCNLGHVWLPQSFISSSAFAVPMDAESERPAEAQAMVRGRTLLWEGEFEHFDHTVYSRRVARAGIIAQGILACSQAFVCRDSRNTACGALVWVCISIFTVSKALHSRSPPDPTLLFLSAGHRAAFEAMAAGIEARQGFVAITGARGVGKRR